MKKVSALIFSVIFMVAVFIIPLDTYAANADSIAGKISISSGKLNIRKSASTDSKVVKTLKKGKYITLISKSGSWWYVEYAKGKYGYCYSSYIKTVESNAAKVNIQSGSLNVRSGAGTSYSKKATLSKNDVVIVISTKGNWKRILYNGRKTGYVNANYLTTLSSSGSSNYNAVSLNVPDYKQTDSRWANVKIGSSGKTISQIGCATTAIAMIESYRQGKMIYPDAMSKKLSYSSSGNLYWPSDYTVVTSSSAYLSKIYSKLKANKPVLFGAKNSSGRQHWVVITGFKGSSTLSTSNFTINDPGSKSRKTLNQFLQSYPSFYKYFYY